MSLGLFNCRLIQLGGDRLFFFATGFAFFSVDLLEGRVRFAAPKPRALDTARPSIECPWKAKGRSDAENLGHPNRRCRTVVETLPVVELEVALDTRSRR